MWVVLEIAQFPWHLPFEESLECHWLTTDPPPLSATGAGAAQRERPLEPLWVP